MVDSPAITDARGTVDGADDRHRRQHATVGAPPRRRWKRSSPAQPIMAVGVSRRSGRLVKSTGDGALAVFADARGRRRRGGRHPAGHHRLGLAGHRRPPASGSASTPGCATTSPATCSAGRRTSPPACSRRDTAARSWCRATRPQACAGRLAARSAPEVGPYLIRGFDEPISIHVVTHPGLPPTSHRRAPPRVGVDDLPADDVEPFGRDDLRRRSPAVARRPPHRDAVGPGRRWQVSARDPCRQDDPPPVRRRRPVRRPVPQHL